MQGLPLTLIQTQLCTISARPREQTAALPLLIAEGDFSLPPVQRHFCARAVRWRGRAEQLPSCDIVIPASGVEQRAADMKIPALSPLSIFGFGQESTPLTSEPEAAVRTSQSSQGWAGPARQLRGEALHGASSNMSGTESGSLSQDMEPLSPVTREYRRRPRNLSSELTEPKVHLRLGYEAADKLQKARRNCPVPSLNALHGHDTMMLCQDTVLCISMLT